MCGAVDAAAVRDLVAAPATPHLNPCAEDEANDETDEVSFGAAFNGHWWVGHLLQLTCNASRS